jgi:glyoxylase-like metal-dependent hydrolase (beta-lactamase superfamily II)
MAEEPVLIHTGIGLDGDDFIAAVSSIVAPERLPWVWLTHDDADHTGSIQRIMELAPNAKLVTHGFTALRMGTSRPRTPRRCRLRPLPAACSAGRHPTHRGRMSSTGSGSAGS